ncbi:MAG: DUF2339 domain-containing protein [bacterium]|nr:DUF2339 domain-containing protein [bacterium]
MIELVAIVALFALFISNRSLASRVSSIETKIKGLLDGKVEKAPLPTQPQTSANPVVQSPQFVAQTPAQAGVIVQATAADVNTAPKEKGASERFSAWVKEDWLMKLGALLFIIGCGWFVSYAFANNWIGPIGRITIGIVAGALLMLLGYWRMMRYPSQGGVFVALGAGVAMLTVFAGRAVYQFFDPVSAVAFDFVFVAFASFASYKFSVRSLAMLAQVLAFVAPLLTAGKTDSFFLFSYLLFISLATLVLAGATGWRDLIVSSLVFIGLYSIPYISSSIGFYGSSYSTDAPLILNFAYLFSMIYLLVGIIAVIRKGVENTSSEIWLAALNGLFLFMWIYNVAAHEWRVLIFSAWAVVFTVGSFIAYRFSSKLHPFFAYGSVAVAFIAAATAAQLEGAALTIAFAIETLALVITVLALTKNVSAATTTSLLFLAPALLSLSSASRYLSSQELFNQDFFVLAIMAISLILAGRIIGSAAKQFKTDGASVAGATIIVFGTLYIWFSIWAFMHILMRDAPDMATMATLVIYTIVGLVAYFSGLYGNDTARRIYGGALLGFVVVRLMIIDVWSMELFGRVVTFFAIGILLMSTAFVTKRKKNVEVKISQPTI